MLTVAWQHNDSANMLMLNRFELSIEIFVSLHKRIAKPDEDVIYFPKYWTNCSFYLMMERKGLVFFFF